MRPGMVRRETLRQHRECGETPGRPMTGQKLHEADPLGSPETFVYAPAGHYLMVYSGPSDRYQRTDWGPNAITCTLQQFNLMTRLSLHPTSEDQDDDDYEYTEWTLAVLAFPDDPR